MPASADSEGWGSSAKSQIAPRGFNLRAILRASKASDEQKLFRDRQHCREDSLCQPDRYWQCLVHREQYIVVIVESAAIENVEVSWQPNQLRRLLSSTRSRGPRSSPLWQPAWSGHGGDFRPPRPPTMELRGFAYSQRTLEPTPPAVGANRRGLSSLLRGSMPLSCKSLKASSGPSSLAS